MWCVHWSPSVPVPVRERYVIREHRCWLGLLAFRRGDHERDPKIGSKSASTASVGMRPNVLDTHRPLQTRKCHLAVGELPFPDTSLQGVRSRLSSSDKFPDVRDKVWTRRPHHRSRVNPEHTKGIWTWVQLQTINILQLVPVLLEGGVPIALQYRYWESEQC